MPRNKAVLWLRRHVQAIGLVQSRTQVKSGNNHPILPKKNVDWLGQVDDCDFNQMLDLPLGDEAHGYLWDIPVNQFTGAPIAMDSHCFGCTADAGSSGGGPLAWFFSLS